MSFFTGSTLADLVATYGYFAVFGLVALESSGIPMPGETALVSAGIYAGTTHRIDITLVVGAAAAGAILGDNLGFWVGREFGLHLLLRHGRHIHLHEGRLKLGQYLFLRHGGAIVFFGRFVAVLRAFAALLAGSNRMPWRGFLVYNALGGVVWAMIFGLGAYIFGQAMDRFAKPLGIAAGIVVAVAAIATWFFFRRHEKQLLAKAEAALPGPLHDHVHHLRRRRDRPKAAARPQGQTPP